MAESTRPDGWRPRGVSGWVAALAQVVLGVALLGAGTAHLTALREEFQTQVPRWLPLDPDLVVVASGWVEIVLGVALLVAWPCRVPVGLVVAAFFVLIFPGNISQFVEGVDGFGLETDLARGVRLLFQPVLVAWALWCTGAHRAIAAAVKGRRDRSTTSA